MTSHRVWTAITAMLWLMIVANPLGRVNLGRQVFNPNLSSGPESGGVTIDDDGADFDDSDDTTDFTGILSRYPGDQQVQLGLLDRMRGGWTNLLLAPNLVARDNPGLLCGLGKAELRELEIDRADLPVIPPSWANPGDASQDIDGMASLNAFQAGERKK